MLELKSSKVIKDVIYLSQTKSLFPKLLSLLFIERVFPLRSLRLIKVSLSCLILVFKMKEGKNVVNLAMRLLYD